MCCGKAFWKRIVAFCLTFGLGLFIAGLFISRQAPQVVKPIVVPAAAENKNCVPADKNLKYENLESKSSTSQAKLEETTKPEAKKPEIKEKSLKNESEKQNNSADLPYYNPSKDSAEFKELLHKEQCFEAQTQ